MKIKSSPETYLARVRSLEAQGLTTSDAQSAVDCENAKASKGAHTPGEWMDCGSGTLLHPVTHAPVSTRVVEAKDWGRIFEVYDYSNQADANFRLILAAPELLAALKNLVETPDVYQADMQQARAALSKAEGRA